MAEWLGSISLNEFTPRVALSLIKTLSVSTNGTAPPPQPGASATDAGGSRFNASIIFSSDARFVWHPSQVKSTKALSSAELIISQLQNETLHTNNAAKKSLFISRI